MKFLWRFLRPLTVLCQRPLALLGALLVALWVGVALLAPVLVPFSPTATLQPFASPGTVWAEGGRFWLGTDHLGRDILSRLFYGARIVLWYAPLATLCAYGVGVPLGLLAGYHGGWVDEILSRLGDIILAFPVLVLYMIILAAIGASGLNIILAITFASAPGIMRLVRGLTITLCQRDYVAAAQIRGETLFFILGIEIFPNLTGPLCVDACLRLGYVIITIGVLGFLGLGLPPPSPDWGNMINETRSMAQAFPWMAIFPCLAIVSLVLGLNLLADGLRDLRQP